jgi:hypothetical protein
LQGPPKFAQIGIFGLKICHLGTLLSREVPAHVRRATWPSPRAEGQSEPLARVPDDAQPFKDAKVTQNQEQGVDVIITFLRFLPNFGEQIGVFLKNKCYDQTFA